MTIAGLRLSQRADWSAGQPISDLMARALANPDLISLAAGFVDQQSLPSSETLLALESIWSSKRSAHAALQYGTTPGFPPLREAILARHRKADGQTPAASAVPLERVVITAGSNQLLHLVGEILLDPGDIVLCGAPTYLVYLGTLSNLGARAVGVATDESGIIPEAIEDKLCWLDRRGSLARVKAIYLVSYFDNPCGLTMPLSRRVEVVEIAKRWSRDATTIHVIEDAAYRDLRYQGEDVQSLQSCDPEGGTVIATGTFSKCYSPGIRVGWGILPPSLVDPVCQLKGNIDFGSPNLSQHLMAKVLELDLLEPHIEGLRHRYQGKLETMLAAAEQHLGPLAGVRWIQPAGGLYVWVELPDDVDTGPDELLFQRAIDEGVLYVPGQFCYPTAGKPVARNCMRLSFGVPSRQQIETGMASLARAVQEVLHG